MKAHKKLTEVALAVMGDPFSERQESVRGALEHEHQVSLY